MGDARGGTPALSEDLPADLSDERLLRYRVGTSARGRDDEQRERRGEDCEPDA